MFNEAEIVSEFPIINRREQHHALDVKPIFFGLKPRFLTTRKGAILVGMRRFHQLPTFWCVLHLHVSNMFCTCIIMIIYSVYSHTFGLTHPGWNEHRRGEHRCLKENPWTSVVEPTSKCYCSPGYNVHMAHAHGTLGYPWHITGQPWHHGGLQGYLFLPVEPPLPDGTLSGASASTPSSGLDFSDLEKQISALAFDQWIPMVACWWNHSESGCFFLDRLSGWVLVDCWLIEFDW